MSERVTRDSTSWWLFSPARADVGAQAVGVFQVALDEARAYANEREQFGQKISEFQAPRHKLARMATRLKASRSLICRTGRVIEVGEYTEATKLAAMTKLFASERAVNIAAKAFQVYGGAGHISNYYVERFHCKVRTTKIYDENSEIQKSIIADQIPLMPGLGVLYILYRDSWRHSDDRY